MNSDLGKFGLGLFFGLVRFSSLSPTTSCLYRSVFSLHTTNSMHRTRNIRVHNAHASHSASAIELPCHVTECHRIFTTTSGRTQHMRRTHHPPHHDQSETPQPTTSRVRPRQQVSPISSPHVTPKPESRSSSPVPGSQPSTPAYGNPDIEMESLPQSQRVEIEDITGQEDEYDDIYVPESPRWSPGARSAGTPVPEHNQHSSSPHQSRRSAGTPVPEHNRHSSSPHQSRRAASSDHEARNPSPTTRIYHPDLNGTLF